MNRKIVSKEEVHHLITALSELAREAEDMGIIVDINVGNVSQLKWEECPVDEGLLWWKTIYKQVPIQISCDIAYKDTFVYYINGVPMGKYDSFRTAETLALAEIDNIVQFWEHPKGGQHDPR